VTTRVVAVRSDAGGIELRVYPAAEGDALAVPLTSRAALLLGADLVALAAGAARRGTLRQRAAWPLKRFRPRGDRPAAEIPAPARSPCPAAWGLKGGPV
jgi:hypothetical protein